MNTKEFNIIGKSINKVDAYRIITGKPSYTDDFYLKGMLYAKILMSPHPHARIKNIDVSKAKALPGVHCVLTYKDIPRVPYTTAGQGYPEPSPYDTVSLDSKVRYVGDRVCAVAAETEEIAEEAIKLINVEYEILPAVLNPEVAASPDAPIIHDETDSKGIYDAKHNIAAHAIAEVGNVEEGFKQADFIIENEYRVHHVQHTPMEPHTSITYLDENGRLVIRTSTQVPFHCRRIVANLVGLPVSKVRVIKPRIGGGYGGKQEVLLEDICAHLTLKTGRPVRLRYTREEEFIGTTTRHPQILKFKTGVMKDGTIVANQLTLLANTGAYGNHALTVQCNTGSKSLPLYRSPNVKFEAKIVYTNLPPSGAFRAYGAPQGYFAMESHIDEIALKLGMDPLEFRSKNHIREGDSPAILEALGEGKAGYKQIIRTCGLAECMKRGAELIGWYERKGNKKQGTGNKEQGTGNKEQGTGNKEQGTGNKEQGTGNKEQGTVVSGIGCGTFMQGSGIPGVDMGSAIIKMNDDGSFNLLVGATDLGTGSDTILAQISAEVLNVPVDKIIVYSSDTDFTPFDPGAYASSTTYISGMAVKKASEEVLKQILTVAGKLLDSPIETLKVENGGIVVSPSGKKVTFSEIALRSLYAEDQFQISATASHVTCDSPPPFGAQFVEVEVDTETGKVKVKKVVTVIDCGVPINPKLAKGQVEGAIATAIGYALTERMIFDENGKMLNPNFRHYKIQSIKDVPEMITEFVETFEPTAPFGAKSVAEIPTNGIAPAIANAIYDAVGIRLRELPFTPEKVLKALKK